MADNEAAIGGNHSQNAGTITIAGGEIIANGGRKGTGIGGGYSGGSCGKITITGGKVSAYGKGFMDSWGAISSAVGIGNGSGGKGGEITITGGTVYAYGGYSEGIGGDEATITIDNGTVFAYGHSYGAGIGTGGSGSIIINGGTVTATGGSNSSLSSSGNGAGIGGGFSEGAGNILITGGVITATAGDNGGYGEAGVKSSMAIGTGGGKYEIGAGGTITVTGGIITAQGGAGGIGGPSTTVTLSDSDAVIFADSITDNDDKSDWSGIIFEGNEGRIYGENYTIDKNLTIPNGKTLIVENGKTLTLASGVAIENNGAVHVNHGGNYIGEQPANPAAYQIDWDTDGDGSVDDTTYVPYGETPEHADGVKTGDAQYSYTFNGWAPALTAVTTTAAYKAQFTQNLNSYEITVPTGTGYAVEYTGGTTVQYGNDFVFKVNVADGYSKTENFAVNANGTLLEAQPDGSYKVNVTADTTITVEGVADITAPENLTVSYDTNNFKKFLNTVTFGLFFKDTVTVTISATDTGSGVKEFTYQLGDGELKTVQAENGSISFTVEPEFKGNIKNVTAADNDGNVSESVDYEYFAVEKKAPTAPDVNTNGYESGIWTNGNVVFTVSGSSATSGIAKYQYSADGGKTWQDMTATEKTDATAESPLNVTKAELTVSADGSTDYIFRAVSNAGNEGEQSDSFTVNIDTAVLTVHFTGNTEAYLQEDTIEIIPTVGYSGLAKVEVKKDGGEWTEITEHDGFRYFYTVKENGTYTFRATSVAGTVGTEKSITYDKLDSAKPVVVIDSGSYQTDTWTKENVALSVSNATENLGTTTFFYKIDDGEWQAYSDELIVAEETDGTTYTFKAVSASGVESDEVSITVKIDKTAPDGGIEVKESSVKKFINEITFGLFFNEDVDVNITGTDEGSGVASIQYYRSEEILTQEQVEAISEWTDYTSISETAEDAKQFVYYAKITDNAGNVTYLCSNGVTFDLTAPVVNGIVDGGTYYTTQIADVEDINLESVTLNDETADTKITLNGNADMTYTIVATDKAGNITTVTVNMKTIASLAKPIADLTADNVTEKSKADVEAVLAAVKAVDQATATEAEKAELKAIADNCEKLLAKIDELQQATDNEDVDNGESSTPTTGDSSNPTLWLALMLASGACLLIAPIAYRRKRKYDK